MPIRPNTPAVRFAVSEDCRLSDLKALLDSYGVEITLGGLVFLRVPLVWIPGWNPAAPNGITSEHLWRPVYPEIWSKRSAAFRFALIRYEPDTEEDDGQRERSTRWPFYVDAPLTLTLALERTEAEFRFTPGNTYTERESGIRREGC